MKLRTCIAAAALALIAPAHAALIGFSGVTDSGPLPGAAFTGMAEFDDPVAAFDGTVALKGLLLDFGGQSYSLLDADAGLDPVAVFAAGQFLGLDFSASGSADTGLRPHVALTAGFGTLADSFFSYVGPGDVQGFGSVTWTEQRVPLPATLGLALTALALLRVPMRTRPAGRTMG